MKHQPEFITISDLPDSIHLAIADILRSGSASEQHQTESKSGRELLNRMADSLFDEKLNITTEKYEKPIAEREGGTISVSFSHTKSIVGAAVSDEYVVGIDMESSAREVHEKLINRMKHPGESEVLYKNHAPIKIWTLKEAALKMIATGLRKPMNGVKIEEVTDNRFTVEFYNGVKSKICSFQHNKHWISICYIPSAKAKIFIPLKYVPDYPGRD